MLGRLVGLSNLHEHALTGDHIRGNLEHFLTATECTHVVLPPLENTLATLVRGAASRGKPGMRRPVNEGMDELRGSLLLVLCPLARFKQARMYVFNVIVSTEAYGASNNLHDFIKECWGTAIR